MLSDPLTYGQLDTDNLVTALKAVAEPTRLRILVLLRDGELNVKDLTQILGQSQPRLSRHLKLLSEAGLVERFREGSWVYFHISERSVGGRLSLRLLESINKDDPVLIRDKRRVNELRHAREEAAQAYFRSHAAHWDSIRSLHVSEHEVETKMRELLGRGPFQQFVDLGSGTGRVLELFSSTFEAGIGIDVNNTMLSYARSKLESAGQHHIQMRHADIYNLPLPDNMADAVCVHQVLHYLNDPSCAITEAARILKPGGQLLIVDFAPHELEFLRENHAHVRLGFSHSTIEGWLSDANIEPTAACDLSPKNGKDAQTLTVSLWKGMRRPKTEIQQTTSNEIKPLEETT